MLYGLIAYIYARNSSRRSGASTTIHANYYFLITKFMWTSRHRRRRTWTCRVAGDLVVFWDAHQTRRVSDQSRPVFSIMIALPQCSRLATAVSARDKLYNLAQCVIFTFTWRCIPLNRNAIARPWNACSLGLYTYILCAHNPKNAFGGSGVVDAIHTLFVLPTFPKLYIFLVGIMPSKAPQGKS